MTDDIARISQLEQDLAEANLKLSTDPQYKIGEVMATLASIEHKLTRMSDAIGELIPRVDEARDSANLARLVAQEAKIAAQGLGSTMLAEHEKTRRAIADLPCHPIPPNGSGRCIEERDTDPAPAIHLAVAT
jgi:hypothetical protein